MKTSRGAGTRKRAIIYTRVSTDEQAEKGYSLRDQEARLRKYCELQGVTIVRHFQDDASAKTFNRPAFAQLLAFVKEHRGEIDLLLFMKWDRFSRNAGEAYRMIRLLADQGIEAQAIEQQIDLSVPENKLMLAFYLAAPEVENERRSLNTIVGMRRAMKEGRYVHHAPKGYKPGRDATNRPIMIPSDDAPYVLEAFTEMAKGIFSMEEVRAKLRRKGFRCSKNQFTLLLRNPVYAGRIVIPAWRDERAEEVEGVHEPIVSRELFAKVQTILDGRTGRRTGKPARRNEELPLRGHLMCSRCGGNLTGSASKGNGGTFYYYHCQKGCRERFRANEANQAFTTYLQSISVAPEVADLYAEVMADIFKEHEGDREKELQGLRSEIATIDGRLLTADMKYVEGKLETDSYHRVKESYTTKKAELEGRAMDLERTDSNFMRYVRYGFSLATDLAGRFNAASLEVKQKMVGLIFPDKVVYSEGTYRTTRLNEAIALLAGKRSESVGVKTEQAVISDGPSYVAPRVGLEPTTLRLTAGCSTIELSRNRMGCKYTGTASAQATGILPGRI